MVAVIAIALLGAMLPQGLFPQRSTAATGCDVLRGPRGVVVVPKPGGATVSWNTVPHKTGCAPVEYRVVVHPGGQVVSAGNALSVEVAGLRNGQPYTVTVAAQNRGGWGKPSKESARFTPGTVPAVPSQVAAIGRDGGAEIRWTAPASDGGSQVTGYRVWAEPGGRVVETSATATRTRIDKLESGRDYTFRIAAVNAFGVGAYSAPSDSVSSTNSATARRAQSAPAANPWPRPSITSSVGATPVPIRRSGQLPGAPTQVTATPAGVGAASVSWAAPGTNGGSVISKYVVRPSTSTEPITVAVPSTDVVVNGLTPGIDHTFTVSAVNDAGEGPQSSPSNMVQPPAGPAEPTNVVVAAANATSMGVTWDPVNNSVLASRYEVRVLPSGVSTQVNGSATRAVVSGLACRAPGRAGPTP